MRLLILDPALIDFSGHHFGYNQAILEVSRRRGVATRVLANANCAPSILEALDAVRCFEIGTYLRPAAHELDIPVVTNYLHGSAFEQNMRSHAPFSFDEEDVVLAHTATYDQILGLLRWYRDLPRPWPRVAIQFMFPPWFRLHSRDRALSIEMQRRAMAAWMEDGDNRVGFFSDSGVLSRYLENLAGVAVRQLPMPIIFPAEPARARTPGEPLTFAYLGEPRLEKGFDALVRALVENRGRSALPLRFVIQTSGIQDAGFIDGLRRALPSDILVNETVSTERYWQLMGAADALLLPYEPAAYELRSSRILVEAVGLGKPVLVTAGTWLDKELDHLGGTGVRAENTPAAVWDGIRRLAEGYDALAAGARPAAEPCRMRNSPDAFVAALLGPA
ncbi:glycosyltransferase family protein [Arenibaculum pallidiluteum]|uniref:hypothetical protein n=1 Tax=Arenibaculum pallidiluteum TaxID=2812559 RepID=UPI001A958331|nr:hypothetical protein [Arenibaculum pallidiluteum]